MKIVQGSHWSSKGTILKHVQELGPDPNSIFTSTIIMRDNQFFNPELLAKCPFGWHVRNLECMKMLNDQPYLYSQIYFVEK